MINLPAITPRKARKKWRIPSLRKGFHPDLLDGVWQPVADTAAELERLMLKYLTGKAVEPGGKDRPAVLSRLRMLIASAVGTMSGRANRMERDAKALGRMTARQFLATLDPKEVARMVAASPKAPRNPARGVTVRATRSLQDSIKAVAPAALGSGMKLYDDVVRAIAAAPPESEAARLRVAQKVLNDARHRGITGLVDASGRRWNLVSYIEMATRTAAGNLAMEAHLKEVTALGLDVVRVTVMPNCHPWCQPYQGRLLSITGVTTGEYDGEKVVTSLADAVAHGFRHVNCRHTVRVHLPGMEAPDPEAIDPGDYKATQELRRLEREIRAAKREEAMAVAEGELKAARLRVRRWQREVRVHVDKTGVPRNRWREQVGHAL